MPHLAPMKWFIFPVAILIIIYLLMITHQAPSMLKLPSYKYMSSPMLAWK